MYRISQKMMTGIMHSLLIIVIMKTLCTHAFGQPARMLIQSVLSRFVNTEVLKTENLPSGTYELRFKMLYEGNDAVDGYKVDGIVLEPKQVEGGVSYPTYTLQIALRNGKGEASKHTLANDV